MTHEIAELAGKTIARAIVRLSRNPDEGSAFPDEIELHFTDGSVHVFESRHALPQIPCIELPFPEKLRRSPRTYGSGASVSEKFAFGRRLMAAPSCAEGIVG